MGPSADYEHWHPLEWFSRTPDRLFAEYLRYRELMAAAAVMHEWLSAGDARFLDKAQKRMEQFVGSSNILVLASHSVDLLRNWCNRGILLQHGRIAAQGDINDVLAAYQDMLSRPPEAMQLVR